MEDRWPAELGGSDVAVLRNTDAGVCPPGPVGGRPASDDCTQGGGGGLLTEINKCVWRP